MPSGHAFIKWGLESQEFLFAAAAAAAEQNQFKSEVKVLGQVDEEVK